MQVNRQVLDMRVVTATSADFDGWLRLASEVEPLFGPMADEPLFHATLRNNFARGTAFCVRDGARLSGGMLWAPERREIAWLAVCAEYRGRGVGSALVDHALSLAQRPAIITVTTFASDVADGAAARRLYERAGFVAGELAGKGPEGGGRQVFRLTLS